uniref:Ig-like domain-containing protein n=1 Tax=Electrophorus electricus TaxID=8005 RepID=A0AAY5EU61_ELEEL
IGCFFSHIFLTGVFCADQIGPKQNQDTEVFHHEGQPVTLECSYDSSSRNVDLYWYRQYPNKAPQYLLYKGARSRSDEHTSDRRFSSIKDKKVNLLISPAAVSDSALYYCALVPTVTGSPAPLYKNLLLQT